MEATGDRCELDHGVKDVSLVVIEHDDVVLEKVRQVCLSVQVEPIFETDSAELCKHLLLLEEVHTLRFLSVSFLVEFHKFEK